MFGFAGSAAKPATGLAASPNMPTAAQQPATGPYRHESHRDWLRKAIGLNQGS